MRLTRTSSRTDLRFIRKVLDRAAESTCYRAGIEFGVSARTVDRWQTRAELLGDQWPNQTDIDKWDTDHATKADVRAYRAAQSREYRKRVYLNRGPLQVPALGTTRRLQALYALGWTCQQMGDRLGVTGARVGRMMNGYSEYAYQSTAQAVKELFDELCMIVPSDDDAQRVRGQVRVHERARADARRRGWVPPLAWDNIDDPDEQPAHTATIGNPRHRERTWNSTEHHACRRCGVVREVRHGRDNLCADCLGIDEVSPRRIRSRHVVPACGTESAYQRHCHSGDTAADGRRVTCAPCLTAHAAHVANKRAGAA